MKKYYVKDDDGSSYEVVETDSDNIEEENESLEDDTMSNSLFTEEEVALLKKLALNADKLIKLVTPAQKDEDVDEDEDEDVIKDEDVDEDKDEDEIKDEDIDEDKDEDEKKSMGDSKKSFGRVAKLNNSTKDDSHQEEIANAWQTNYIKYLKENK